MCPPAILVGPAMSLQARAPQPKAEDPVGEVKAKEVVLGAEGTPVQGLRCHRLTWIKVSAPAAAGCASKAWSSGNVVTGNCWANNPETTVTKTTANGHLICALVLLFDLIA